MNNKIELLAPVGSIEALHAAVQNGCDALYLGYYKFGARSSAGFSNEEMIEAVEYAHLYGVNVYVTVNTIIYENEFKEFQKAIDFLVSINVDALIVQDFGVLLYLREVYPDMEVHASTQMHVHNVEGAKLAKEFGISRVVMPRELSIEEIKKIKKQADVEVEVFVHGALCVSYSGQCLISSVSHNRSGNRGECAQNCRLKYDLVYDDKILTEKDKYLLSTKDLNNISNIDKLIEAQVDSLKIEGRLKRPEYVAVVVGAYRKAIDNYYKTKQVNTTFEDTVNLKKIFNREFTPGYLMDKSQLEIVNIRSNSHIGVKIGNVIRVEKNRVILKLTDDLNIDDGIRIGQTGYQVNNMYVKNILVKVARKNEEVTLTFSFRVNAKKGDVVLKTTDAVQLKEARTTYQNNTRKVQLNMKVTCLTDDYMYLELTDNSGNMVYVSTDIKSEKALNKPLTKDRLISQLSKLGSTIYTLNNIEIDIDDGIIIPIKAINEIRRQGVEELNKHRLNRQIIEKKDFNLSTINVDNTSYISVLVNNLEQLKAVSNYPIDNIYYSDNSTFNKALEIAKVKRVLPRVSKEVKRYQEDGLIGELGNLFIQKNKEIIDSSFNVVNSNAVYFFQKLGVNRVTLSEELTHKQTKDIVEGYKKKFNSLPNLEAIIYNRTELMITEYCPINAVLKGPDKDKCSLCKNKQFYLKNNFNELLPIVKGESCVTKILNMKVTNNLKLINSYKQLGINNFRINFSLETYDKVSSVLDKVFKNKYKK